MASEEASQVKVAIDCDYDDLMSNKDIRQFVKQIQRSYAENRRSPKPLQFYLCNLTGKTADVLNECSPGYVNWDVHIKSEKPTEIFSKEKIVYLTSDSPNVLETLDEDKIYIIGGLVDHNHHKGLCHKRAVEAGIAHAQLPISDYVKLQSRTVLVINHVFEILVKYVQSGDWRQAFFSVIPQRKGVSNLDNGDALSQGNDRHARECDKPCPGDDEKVTKETASSSEDKEETDKETIAISSGKAKENKDDPGNDTSNDNRKGGEIDNEVGCETESVINKEDEQSTDL
ncbi:tRNA methyltransferase 10 homolog A-like isoform X2 [Ptychodera flava]